MRAGDKFIGIYNEMSLVLQEATHASNQVPFSNILEQAAKVMPSIRKELPFLKSMGDLRNAIVHDRKYPPIIIADPRDEVVEKFTGILKTIKSPKKVIPKFQKRIVVFEPQHRLGDILAHMQENDYSQTVVRLDEEFRVLSSEGIVRWLSSARQVGLADIEGASAQDVYVHEEGIGCYMARNETIDAALLVYENAISNGIPRLPAILITDNGKPTEKPLGIITPWDLIGISGK